MNAAGTCDLLLAPGELMGPAVSRAVAAVGARAGLSTDRLVDALVAASLIVSGLKASAAEPRARACLRVASTEEGLAIAVGPLPAGGGERIRALEATPGLDVTIDRIADRVSVEPAPGGERLLMLIGRDVPV